MSLNLTLIIEVVSFLILLFLLTKFLYKPILKFLDQRSEAVRQWLEEAKASNENAQNLLAQAKKELEASKEKALEIKKQTRIESDKLRARMLDDAKKDAQRLVMGAKEDINKQIEDAKRDLRRDIANLSLQIARKIIGRELKENDHKRLVEEGINSIENGRNYSK